MFEKITEHLGEKFLHKRGWQNGNKTLRQRDLFILPNRYGLYVAFLIFASFGLGYKVQNNFILIGVIFLFLLFILSLISAVKNLQGIEINLATQARNFASETVHITCGFKKSNPSYNTKIYGVLDLPKGLVLDMSSKQAFYRLPVLRAGRGRHKFPPIKLQTQFPFGIVRCWSWLSPPLEILIAPSPVEYPLSSYPQLDYMRQTSWQAQNVDIKEADAFWALRAFQEGDLPSRIDWKRFAATREVFIRSFEDPRAGDVLLEASEGMIQEDALSYLCGGLCVCERAGVNAVMSLGGERYFISTKQQFDEAFNVLACH